MRKSYFNNLPLICAAFLIVGVIGLHGHPPLPEVVNKRPRHFEIVKGENLIVDLMYTRNNIFGPALYPSKAKAWLHEHALVKLQHAAALAHKHGYKLIVLDAYRPFSTTVEIWNYTVRTGGDLRLIAPPWIGSDHNRGIAVDVTLRTLKGDPVILQPVGCLRWQPCNGTIVLHKIMKEAGFTRYDEEWWHFALPNNKNFPIYNFPL